MTIYFLRHASAGERKKDPAKDAKRGLDRVGIEQAVQMGRVLAGLESHLDVILTSPLKRAAQTATLVANEMGYEGKLVVEASLRPGAAFSAFQQALAKHAGHESMLVVGHNPNLSQFLGRLIGDRSRPAHVSLRKASLARVDTLRGAATLHWLLTPKAVTVNH